MKISAVDLSYPGMTLKKMNQYQKAENQLTKEQQLDTFSYKGVKNAARMGAICTIGGSLFGLLFVQSVELLNVAAAMAGIKGFMGAFSGLLHSDKHNILKN